MEIKEDIVALAIWSTMQAAEHTRDLLIEGKNMERVQKAAYDTWIASRISAALCENAEKAVTEAARTKEAATAAKECTYALLFGASAPTDADCRKAMAAITETVRTANSTFSTFQESIEA